MNYEGIEKNAKAENSDDAETIFLIMILRKMLHIQVLRGLEQMEKQGGKMQIEWV